MLHWWVFIFIITLLWVCCVLSGHPSDLSFNKLSSFFFPWLCILASTQGQTLFPLKENGVCRQEGYCSEHLEMLQVPGQCVWTMGHTCFTVRMHWCVHGDYSCRAQGRAVLPCSAGTVFFWVLCGPIPCPPPSYFRWPLHLSLINND